MKREIKKVGEEKLKSAAAGVEKMKNVLSDAAETRRRRRRENKGEENKPRGWRAGEGELTRRRRGGEKMTGLKSGGEMRNDILLTTRTNTHTHSLFGFKLHRWESEARSRSLCCGNRVGCLSSESLSGV